MSVDRAARVSLLASLERYRRAYARAFSRARDRITRATAPEEIMAAKQRLLLDLVAYLPIDADTCYFCRLYSTTGCDSCPYARVHGQCSAPGSDHFHICAARRRLLFALGCYYRGEVYPNRDTRETTSREGSL